MREKIKPSILPGFMELGPREQLIFEDIVSKMIQVYKRNGCLPMDTPIIEKEEILLAKSAGETEKQVYRIDKEKMKQALRFDLTVPFARYVVQHMNELAFPFKRYQLGKVYRGERNQKGRYREFYQLDIDIVNPNRLDIGNDAYVINLAAQAFESIGLTNYKFQISNRKILAGVLDVLEIETQQEVMGLIDKYDKMGGESCMEQLQVLIGREKADIIQNFIEIQGTVEDCIEMLKMQFGELAKYCKSETTISQGYVSIKEGIDELEDVMGMVDAFGVRKENAIIDLKIIRGLDYYTGTVFETVLVGNEVYGSICSGGRYDNLTGLYTEQKMPGVGISIGITRLFFVLGEIGFIEKYSLVDQMTYLICPIGNTLKVCIEINRILQQQGILSEVYMNGAPLKKQLSYANTRGINQVILVGEAEWLNGEVIFKDMLTGTQIKKNWGEWKQGISK
nr:histidine--tRNA ligase [uncultured Niameybacter sp.]